MVPFSGAYAAAIPVRLLREAMSRLGSCQAAINSVERRLPDTPQDLNMVQSSGRHKSARGLEADGWDGRRRVRNRRRVRGQRLGFCANVPLARMAAVQALNLAFSASGTSRQSQS